MKSACRRRVVKLVQILGDVHLALHHPSTREAVYCTCIYMCAHMVYTLEIDVYAMNI